MQGNLSHNHMAYDIAQIIRLAAIYNKIAQQTNTAEDIKALIHNLLNSIKMSGKYVLAVSQNQNNFNISIHFTDFYNADGQWVKPSDVKAMVEDFVRQQLPNSTIVVNVPFDESQMPAQPL